ncbi:DNA-directed RNA polymerase I subunit RPA43 [Penicillium subrubescens]|uniref:DNA-directed RNA polymerase subunit n=1 Tax=Penicillium subrubescens TaxID=1316194 RepID=A0A1Q5ULC8_9EURO|nr:DNA-directed RNA polymerase I subunit RPA43 [Penicillium subrubescens]
MALDAMDLDTSPAPTDVERKRKHKNKDASPSKKRKQVDQTADKTKSKSSSKKDKSSTSSTGAGAGATTAGTPGSPFSLTTATLYLPLAPISISSNVALQSLLTEHISPLLLTYYPPLKGIVLAYSHASISATPPSSTPRNSSADPNPKPLTMARSADEYGVLYVYLTATFLVFRPQRGQTLEGWVNVQSEGFLGAVLLNLFSVGIERKRLPTSWTWVPPGEDCETSEGAVKDLTTDDESGVNAVPPSFDAEKELFQPAALAADELDIDGEAEEEEAASGHFQSISGHKVRGNIKFRVVDIDVIPGSERDRGFLSIEGTMLTAEEEEALLAAERQGQALPPSFLGSPRRKNGRIVPISSSPAADAVVDVSVVEIEEPTGESVSVSEPVEKKKEKKEKKEKKDKSKSKKEKKEKSNK